MNVVMVIWSQGEDHNECRDNCRANGIHADNIMQCQNANYLAVCIQRYRPTPAYRHGNEDIAFDVRFEHRHQLPVQVDGFSCHPKEHDQEEVVHECGDNSAEHRNTHGDRADDEGDIQPKQSSAEVEQQLYMESLSEVPEWHM